MQTNDAGRELEVLSEEEMESLFHQALELSEAGQTDEAIGLLDRLIQSDPDMPAPHFFKGIALGNDDRHDEAAASFLEAYHRAPGSPEVLFNLAGACLQTERWQAAMSALLQYLDIPEATAKSRAELLLGLAASGACQLKVFREVAEFFGHEEELQRQSQSGEYVYDASDTRIGILSALSMAARVRHKEAHAKLQSLSARNRHEENLLARAAPMLDAIARWALDQAADSTDAAVEPLEAAAWESSNAPLREYLARFARYFENGLGPSKDDVLGLLQAFHSANLLVPVSGEIQQSEDGAQAFSIMLQPHEPSGGQLLGLAFTGIGEVRAYFEGGYTLNRAVIPGDSLSNLLVQMAQSLEPLAKQGKSDAPTTVAGTVVNPAGPHPYIFRMPELQHIAAMKSGSKE